MVIELSKKLDTLKELDDILNILSEHVGVLTIKAPKFSYDFTYLMDSLNFLKDSNNKLSVSISTIYSIYQLLYNMIEYKIVDTPKMEKDLNSVYNSVYTENKKVEATSKNVGILLLQFTEFIETVSNRGDVQDYIIELFDETLKAIVKYKELAEDLSNIYFEIVDKIADLISFFTLVANEIPKDKILLRRS